MSFRRRHRWLRRLALGLAVFGAVAAGNAGYAVAKVAPGTSNTHDADEMQVIPYLSHGILTEAQRDAALAEAVHDPYLTDVFVRPGEAAAGPDGMSVKGQGILTETGRDGAAAEAIRDPAVIPSRVSVDGPAIRPDDARSRFAHSDVAGKPEPAGGGSTLELDEALTAGIGALVLTLGLGLALGVLRRPRLAGF